MALGQQTQVIPELLSLRLISPNEIFPVNWDADRAWKESTFGILIVDMISQQQQQLLYNLKVLLVLLWRDQVIMRALNSCPNSQLLNTRQDIYNCLICAAPLSIAVLWASQHTACISSAIPHLLMSSKICRHCMGWKCSMCYEAPIPAKPNWPVEGRCHASVNRVSLQTVLVQDS